MDYITLYHLHSFVMINNTCSMISMDIIATNHKHSRILAQTSLGQRPKKDGREVQASISPFASMTFHPSIACRTALMSQKEAALPNTGGFERYTNRLGKRSNLRHRILHTISYTMYYYVKADSLPTSPNTWLIYDDLYSKPSKDGPH